MGNDNQQKFSDIQKSAKKFAKSGAEMAKHAKSAVKTGVNLAASTIEEATGENGSKAIKQAKEKVLIGANKAASKMESVAEGSNSALLRKATSSRKKTLILLAGAAIIIAVLVVAIFGGNNHGGSNAKITKDTACQYVIDHIPGLDKKSFVVKKVDGPNSTNGAVKLAKEHDADIYLVSLITGDPKDEPSQYFVTTKGEIYDTKVYSGGFKRLYP